MNQARMAILVSAISCATLPAFADDDRNVIPAGGESLSLEPFAFKYDPGARPSVALAQVADTDKWRIDFNTWLWLMGIEGDVGAHGLTKGVDASFADVLDASDSVIGISGRLEIGKGKIGGFVDGLYTKLGIKNVTINQPDINPNANIDFEIDLGAGPFNPNPNPDPNPDLSLGLLPAEIDITMELAIVDFGLMYRLGEWPRGDQAAVNRRNLTLDAYAGARYTMLSIEVETASGASRERERDWIDPIVGLKTAIPIGEDWEILAWGDIGGFGVSSDFTWSATGVVGYHFTLFDLPATVFGGYRAIGYDYSNGSGRDEFVWDVTLHGPILGFKLAF